VDRRVGGSKGTGTLVPSHERIDRVGSKRWVKRHWPTDAEPDPRFVGLNGAVAELTLNGDVAGFAMMLLQQWATQEGVLWRKRLVDARDLLQLQLVLMDGSGRVVGTPEWFTHDRDEAARMYEECVLSGRLEWDDGVTYGVRWLDAQASASVRAEHFWEPDED
jgi:hypothetical protein